MVSSSAAELRTTRLGAGMAGLAPLACAARLATPYLLTHGSLIGVALQRGFAHRLPSAAGAVGVDLRRQRSRVLAMSGDLSGSGDRAVIPDCHARLRLRVMMAAAAINLLDVAPSWQVCTEIGWAVRFALGFVLGASGALLIASSVDQSQCVPPLRGSD